MITSSKASIRHGKTDGFRPGVPALDVFPVKAWNKYLFDAMTSHERRNLSYGPVTGSAALRQGGFPALGRCPRHAGRP